MTKDDTIKRAALALLTKGLASQSEVARLAGISRQLMKHWAKDIPVDRAREAVLAKLWRKAMARN